MRTTEGAAALRTTDLVDVHRLQERAALLTRRITLEVHAEEEADEQRILGQVTRESEAEDARPSRPVVPWGERGWSMPNADA